MVALASTLLAFVSRFRGAAARRRRAYAVAIPLGFLVFAILIGCGGGGYNSPPQPSGGTPAGNYTLTITGTSNGVSHSETLTVN